MATYKATRRGHIGRLIEAGETFEFDGPKGSWMEEVEASDIKPEGKGKDKPEGKGK